MKRLKVLIIVFTVLVFTSTTWAAGSCVQSIADVSRGVHRVTLVCTGDSGNGTIPNTDINDSITGKIVGSRLVEVKGYPTDGGTAPDAADVLVYDTAGMDLLGSGDGANPYAGTGLIHATLERVTPPYAYLSRAGSYVSYYPVITGVLTVDVDGQDTASADFTVELIFLR